MSRRPQPQRANRYQIECPLRFRRRGERDWHQATLRNMSTSGLLFQADVSIPDEAEIVIVVSLPPGLASIWCRAVVVRRDPATGTIGARITAEYRLQRSASLDASV